MRIEKKLFSIIYSIAALLVLIGLNIYAYIVGNHSIPENDLHFLSALSHYSEYSRQLNSAPDQELERAVHDLKKYRKQHPDSNSGERLFLVLMSQKYLAAQRQHNSAAMQEIYNTMIEQVGKNQTQTVAILIKTVDRFNQELQRGN